MPPTRLVSVAWASSELGVLQPMRAIHRLCQQAGVPLHSDAVQVVGQLPAAELLPLPVDALSISAHKFQGPRGVGALVMPKPQGLQPQLLGGGQESGLRSGTESPWLVAAMVDALELRFNHNHSWPVRWLSCGMGFGSSYLPFLALIGLVAGAGRSVCRTIWRWCCRQRKGSRYQLGRPCASWPNPVWR